MDLQFAIRVITLVQSVRGVNQTTVWHALLELIESTMMQLKPAIAFEVISRETNNAFV